MLTNYIKNITDFEPRFIIGRNGSGKTYLLNRIYSVNSNNTIMLTEDGELKTNKSKSLVNIDFENMNYIFSDHEKKRGNGQAGRSDTEVQIDGALRDMLVFCNSELLKINKIISKSKGQEKIHRILKVLVSIFLNSIRVIVIDEPENYLDDYYLNFFSILIKKLSNSKIKIIIATHSPRLCELCNLDIDNIYIIDIEHSDDSKINYIESNIKIDQVKKKFRDISDNINSNRLKNGYNNDEGVGKKLDIHLNDEIFNLYISCVLKTEDFYRALFYKKVFIVEGYTEKLIIKDARRDFKESTYFFCADGKPFVPIFSWIFSTFNKNVTIIIDSDSNKDSSKALKIQVSITEYLTNNFSNIRVFNQDLETHFNIDNHLFKKENNLPKNWSLNKPLAAKQHFENKKNRLEFIKFIE